MPGDIVLRNARRAMFIVCDSPPDVVRIRYLGGECPMFDFATMDEARLFVAGYVPDVAGVPIEGDCGLN